MIPKTKTPEPPSNKTVNLHNTNTADEYIRKIRMKRRRRGSSSHKKILNGPTLKPWLREEGKPETDSVPRNDKPPLGQTVLQERATVGSTSNQKNAAFQKMLSNCCNLIGPLDQHFKSRPRPKQREKKVNNRLSESTNLKSMQNPYLETKKRREPIASGSKLRRRLSQNVTVKNTNSSPTKGRDKLQQEIQLHNKRYRRERSISYSKRKNQNSTALKHMDKQSLKVQKALFTNSYSTSSQNKSYRGSPTKDIALYSLKPQRGIMTGLKDVSKNFMSTFKKKKWGLSSAPKSYKEDFKCNCNKKGPFKKIAFRSERVCKTMASLISSKFPLEDAHSNLQTLFIQRKATGSLDPTLVRQIRNDVDRTFGENPYMSNERARRDLQELLEVVALTFPEVGYVQGMNFIAATAYYHGDIFYAYGFVLTLFDYLDIKDIFLPNLPGLGRHFSVIDTLILLNLKKVYSVFSKTGIDVHFFCTELLMCVGMNVIPIEHSGLLMQLLLEYGWNYFYRLIIFYLKLIERRILAEKDEGELRCLLKMLRNGRRKDGEQLKIGWPKLLTDSLYFQIEDKLVDSLIDRKRGCFKACPTQAQNKGRGSAKQQISSTKLLICRFLIHLCL